MAGYSEIYVTFPEWVKDGLEARASREFLEDTKTAWVRMTSNFESDGKRRGLMGGDISNEKAISFGFTSIYEAEGRIPPKRPTPGITSVSIKTIDKNYKEISVDWKAWSLDQLERLMPYFMNPSITVVLEVGWSDIDYGTIINPLEKEEVKPFYASSAEVAEEGSGPSTVSSTRSYKKHERFQTMKEAEGNYYVFPGQIKNFSYEMNNQGGFDCTTELQSVTESTFALSGRAGSKSRKDDKKESKSLLEIIKQDLEFKEVTGKQLADTNVNIEEGENEPVIKAEGGQTFPTSSQIGGNFYFSWGEIEAIVNAAFKLKKANSNQDDFELYRYDSLDTKVSYYRDTFDGQNISLKSTDLSVCLLNGGDGHFEVGEGMIIPQFDHKKHIYLDLLTLDDNFEPYLEVGDEGRGGWLYHLFISAEVFKDAIEQNEKVSEALLQMLNEASSVCHDIWDWEIMAEDETNVLSIIDRNFLFRRSVENMENIYSFDMFSKTSNVRDISLSADMEGKGVQATAARNLQTAAGDRPVKNDDSDTEGMLFNLYGGKDVVLEGLKESEESVENDETNTSSDGDGDGSQPKEDDPLSDVVAVDKRALSESLDSPPSHPKNRELANKLEERNEQYKKWDDFGYVDHIYPLAGEILKIEPALMSDKSGTSAFNANALVPIDLTITITGMAGLRRYQVFEVKHTPAFLKDNGVFTITSVSHSISGNDWETTIEGKYVVGNAYAKNVE